MNAVAACALSLVAVTTAAPATQPALLLVVAYDGLRYDNITAELMPNLHALAQRSSWSSKGVVPRFPTETTPNFVSLSTGLEPESHGIIANKFYDSSGEEPRKFDWFNFDNDTAVMEDSRTAFWYQSGVPLWQANEGRGGRSACFEWPTCDASYNGIKPPDVSGPYTNPANVSVWEQRADRALGQFLDPNAPANLVLLYIVEPDETQHANEIGNSAVRKVMQDVDELTEYILLRVARTPELKDRLNMIFLSDHGHENKQYLKVYEQLDDDMSNSFQFVSRMIYPASDAFDESAVKAALDAAKSKDPQLDHFTVYRRSEFPEKFHFADNARVAPLIVLPDPSYWPLLVAPSDENQTFDAVVGGHGFPNEDTNMRAFFIAHGPAFRNVEIDEPFANIDLYPLVCRLLQMEGHCGAHNASLFLVNTVLRVSPHPVSMKIILPVLFVVPLLAALLWCCSAWRGRKRNDVLFSRKDYVPLKPLVLEDFEPSTDEYSD